MISLLNVQYSVFSNDRIEPSSERIKDMLEKLNAISERAFIPSIIAGQNIDLQLGSVRQINNITFLTLDRKTTISCLNERIDVTIEVNEEYTAESIREQVLFAQKALKEIMETNRVHSNRLAINVGVLNNLIDDSFQDTPLARQLCRTLEYYKEKRLDEWSSRTNSRVSILMDQEETLNVITDISKAINKKTGEIGILCHIDVNTIFENQGYRFSYMSLGDFDEKVVDEIERIIECFVEANNG